jgi:hypothetical protein
MVQEMIRLERLPDARQRLDSYLDTLDSVPFEWAGIHCATFAADVVNAQTGHDFAEGHRGAYSTMEEAIDYLKGLGFDSIGDYAASLLQEIPTSQMVYGDVCTVKNDDGSDNCLAVYTGQHLTVMTLRGKGAIPRGRAIRAFAIEGRPVE